VSRQARRRLFSILLFFASIGCIVVGLLFAGQGFAGPGAIALAAAGGCLTFGYTLWRPPPG